MREVSQTLMLLHSKMIFNHVIKKENLHLYGGYSLNAIVNPNEYLNFWRSPTSHNCWAGDLYIVIFFSYD